MQPRVSSVKPEPRTQSADASCSAIISSRVPDEPESDYITWRNYTLTNVSGIVGPLIAGSLANVRVIGRKYTMVIGALLTMAFFFGYTAITTTTQNVVFSCVIGTCSSSFP